MQTRLILRALVILVVAALSTFGQLARAATIEWANVGSTFSTGTNWVGGTAPADSTVTDIGSFGSTGSSAVNPNLNAGRSINGISFISGAFAYTIDSSTGSALLIGVSGITNSASNTETFGSGIILRTSTSQTWTNNGGALVFNGVVDIVQNAGGVARTLTVNGSGNTTFNGIIQNSAALSTGNLTYSGTGILTLAGANIYTGTTTLNSGTTLINGNQTAATGAVTVSNSGTVLGGTGTIGGATTINAGAQITGATAGTIGALTLTNNLTFTGAGGNPAGYLVDIAAGVNNSDRLTIGGTLNLTDLNDQITFSGSADGTSSYLLASAALINGTFDSVSNLPTGYSLIYTTSTLTLVPIPEPATWVGGALVLGLIGWTQRKRFARKLTI